MKKKVQAFFKKRYVKIIAIILAIALVSIPSIWEIAKPGYYTNHDGEGHIIRLQEYDIALKEGNFPVRVSKNLMYGYGYYFFNFNYPLVYWMGEAAHLVGFDYVNSVKVVSILGVVLSGIAMFVWQRKYWGFLGAFVASVFYMYTPYRLLTLHVRGALAEHLAYIMLPMLFLFSERIAEDKNKEKVRYMLWGALAYALLMVSHNITAFIFSLMLGLFMLFHVFLYKNWKLILYYAGVVFVGMAMSAFFWFPALSEKGFVRLDQTIGQDYPDHFVYVQQLFQRSWGFGGSGAGLNDGLSFQVGIFNWLVLALGVPAVYILWKKAHDKALHVAFYIFLFFMSVWFMLPMSKVVWENVPLFPFTQFPWRFLSWSVFTTSIIAGMVVYALERKFKKSKKLVTGGILVFISLFIISNQPYWQVNQRVEIKLPGDRPIPGSTTWADEQFPKWFEPKPDKAPEQRVELLGEGEVQVLSWETPKHEYIVDADEDLVVVENTAYYPGWEVRVDGVEKEIQYERQDYPGRIVFEVEKGEHGVVTMFSETRERLIVDIISLVTLIGSAVVLVYTYLDD